MVAMGQCKAKIRNNKSSSRSQKAEAMRRQMILPFEKLTITTVAI